VIELVDLILRKMGSTLRPEVLNQASNEIRHQFLSAERARTILNWKPQFTLESGLDRTLGWYREFLGAPAAVAHAGRDSSPMTLTMTKTASHLRDEIHALVRQYCDVALAPRSSCPAGAACQSPGKS